MRKRFFTIKADNEGSLTLQTKIIVDTQTGVQYLYAGYKSFGGLTVLVDGEGKPLLYRPTPLEQ